MKKLLYIIMITTIILSSVSVCALGKEDDISVVDYSGVLADSAKEYVNSKNEILFSHCGAKIIFVTTPSTGDASIVSYTESLYKELDVNVLGRKNSVFFVMDTEKMEYAFVVGKGIRYALTETMIYKYIVDSFEPEFANEQYEKATIGLYNAIGRWYEENYAGLNLGLDDNTAGYTYGEKKRDIAEKGSLMWVWIGLGICVVAVIVIFKIKRSIQLKIRKMERRRLKRKFQIDIDKIVNS